MARKLVSKKELKTVYGIPYCFAHIARLEAAGKFPTKATTRSLPGGVVRG
jgi:prophage regulatory protein